MWKWIIWIVVFLIVLAMIIKPEWMSVIGSIFLDYIRANET